MKRIALSLVTNDYATTSQICEGSYVFAEFTSSMSGQVAGSLRLRCIRLPLEVNPIGFRSSDNSVKVLSGKCFAQFGL
jgi:hypothetical protein